jgi:hypothetical protein
MQTIRFTAFVIATLVGFLGCHMEAATAAEYMVTYAAKGTKAGMAITMATPSGTEQHQVGASYVSEPYFFRSGEYAYISAQNLGNGGKVTAMLVYGRKGMDVVKLETSSTGRASIATASWVVGDEKPRSKFLK